MMQKPKGIALCGETFLLSLGSLDCHFGDFEFLCCVLDVMTSDLVTLLVRARQSVGVPYMELHGRDSLYFKSQVSI